MDVGWTGKAMLGDLTPDWVETNHGLFFAVDIQAVYAMDVQTAIVRFNNQLYMAADDTLYKLTGSLWVAVQSSPRTSRRCRSMMGRCISAWGRVRITST